MRIGIGLYKKYRLLIAYANLIRFELRKIFIGFDVANQFLSHVDKYSVIPILKRNGATIGEDCEIETGLVIHNCNNYSNLTIGNNCHIGKNCFFDLRDVIVIKDNVVIAMNVTLITHFDIYYSPLREYYPEKQNQLVIGMNSCIGAGTTILMGTVIENDCYIAAGALVNRNVQENTIVGGVPARFIKKIKF